MPNLIRLLSPSLGIPLALAACAGTAPEPDEPLTDPTADPTVTAPSVGSGVAADASADVPVPPPAVVDTHPINNFKCTLDEPLLSEDSCTTDSDCGVSAPCHAPACVATAKADPPKKDTICTMSMECKTADANRCGCHEGRCALIPRED